MARRRDVAAYLTLLRHVMLAYPEICDLSHFRIVTDLLAKIVGREKHKCIEILHMYVKYANEQKDAGSGHHIADMLELVLPALPLDTDVAFELCRAGLAHMRAAQLGHVRARAAAARRPPALLLLLDDLRERTCSRENSENDDETSEPPAKRRALEGVGRGAEEPGAADEAERRAGAALAHADPALARAALHALAAVLPADPPHSVIPKLESTSCTDTENKF
ncbi:uncharacterized protein LOC123699340 [Colias croceus]|uniref:uncharacterized protein LOC123699340 n=1 Tax=Colias crocea TaxID=72248 RepID=UPI001E27DA6E|nr:uncharacterized protein LOC123699340 [Colias croceus]